MIELPTLDDRAIVAARGPRNRVDATRPYAYLVEQEPSPDRAVEDVATVFITNRECPFRCLMCDLWKNTTTQPVPDGAVADQIEWALDRLPYAPCVKLYNSGNFFDAKAVPRADLPRIAMRLGDRRVVIVECHPELVGRSCIAFAESLGSTKLQVAMGLETVDPNVLPRLNKNMTLDDFERATSCLLQHGVDVRAFILLRTPYQSESDGLHWAMRSIDFALSIGVECCAVIPVRTGNGIMEQLERDGGFSPPSIHSLEAVLEYGLNLKRGRVFVDLWDVERFCDCAQCGPERVERLRRMNLTQTRSEPVNCSCG